MGQCKCETNANMRVRNCQEANGFIGEYWKVMLSLVMLVAGGIMNQLDIAFFKENTVSLVWYVLAYLPVGLPVIKEAWESILQKDYFSEFTLMSVATLGAFYIGEYPEGVAVMLFYSVGELFQDRAIDKAKRNISALLDVRPEKAMVVRGNEIVTVNPKSVFINEIIEIKAGERVPLDGIMLNEIAAFNTAALTGESVPRDIRKGEEVLAGMIVTNKVIRMKVTKPFDKSALARILELVEDASERKAPAELFIRKFARIYTPIVIGLARLGILFKGGNYLDAITRVNTVVFDKTGTLTKGVFEVESCEVIPGVSKEELIRIIASVEKNSTHPIAKAIVSYAEKKKIGLTAAENIEEVAGYGLMTEVDGEKVLVGNARLLSKYSIEFPAYILSITETTVVCAVGNKYIGYITLSDVLKDDAADTVRSLKELNIKNIQILSGDKQSIVSIFANKLGLTRAYGDLLPEGKVEHMEKLKENKDNRIAFVGDGMNDAPVLALSDVGIAMGGLGSDAAIETADVVIQTDQPSKVATAIKVGRCTRRIIWQNVSLAFGVKLLVMVLGASGIATLWEAVFADVGVTLIAIVNAIRIQKMIK